MRPALILILTVLLAACSGPKSPFELEFGAVYRDEPLLCDAITHQSVLTDLRFFVHAMELRATDGEWHRIKLDDDPAWQQADLAMIDLEDGTWECMNGSNVTRNVVTGTVPTGDYEGIRFALGVPFDRNHRDPLEALPPLDDPAMHWHWRSGYKFLRAGLATQEDGFWIHLGSTGCEGTVGDITSCSSPNRAIVALDDFVPGRDRIVFDFAALIEGTNLDDAEASDCSSSPAEESCRSPFAALGINFDSGSVDGTQRVFKVATR
jgi:uncharacterized repeat protein (TIGR04052 family)